MSVIPDHFKLHFKPAAAPEAVVRAGNARFTLLTDRLIRLEYHPEGCFEDRSSQAFWFREQPVPQFSKHIVNNCVEIETDYLHLQYDFSEDGSFTPDNLTIHVKSTDTTWHYADQDRDNLLGTTRTLDFANGYVACEPGLMSRAGWSVIDDSSTLVFNDDHWLEPRYPDGIDLYFFGYGHDYKACLQDYCRVSGKMPMIPRWILGNWWSRYWAYSQDELSALVNDFEQYELPLSVCIIDMDWHITETGNDSTGWTGYSWNRKLFPDPEGFIDFAHQKNLKIGLNLHPAEGIHSHETQYAEMAQAMGIDPESKQPVQFDVTDPAFVSAYLKILHHPYEAMGVDFWWLDWQQGLKSKMPGLDPLWLINHLHFYDLGRDGSKRPFIFSRWGREGHQRYPIGFSGDSYATWDTLNFQSYMTTTASNIAYGWWSHDIGGHTSGTEDPELFARWVQFGAFSPINRIHATKGLFYDRRPWFFEDGEVLRVVRDAMHLRHAFIPYIYTMARRAAADSLPLIEPMYYDYPEVEDAYHAPHQYLFGSELIAAPFVNPADEMTGLSKQVVWLPEGEWYHFFTGEHYKGNRWQPVYGRLADIPLFAKAGAIVPLAGHSFDAAVTNPDELHVHVFAGADNSFTLYEDDGATTAYEQGHACQTTFTQGWEDNRLSFSIDPAEGDTSLIPSVRTYQLLIHGVKAAVELAVTVDGKALAVETTYDAEKETLCLAGIELGVDSALELTLTAAEDSLVSQRDRKTETILRMLKFFKLNTGVRNHMAANLNLIMSDPKKLAPYTLLMSETQARALCEILFDAGLHVIHDTVAPTLLLLWNNQDQQSMRFRYSDAYLFFGMVQSINHDEGVMPRSQAIIPPINRWSHGAQDEIVHRTQWQAQIDYPDILTVLESYREVSP